MAEYVEYDWRTQIIQQNPNILAKNNKNNKNKIESAIIELQNLLKTNDLKTIDKQDLLKFLYARKFKIPETFQLIENYYSYREKNEELFKNFTINAKDIEKSLQNGLPGVLSSKDRKGRCVLILNATNWDCSYSLLSIYRAILLTLEHLINDVYIQSQGFIVLVDWTEFTFKQSTNLKPSILRLMIEGLQDCFPARFKGIHFIGQPWYIETALTLIRPFLKEKMKERIFLHGNNLSTLHDLVHRDILPAELGGEQPSYNPQIWLDILKNAT